MWNPIEPRALALCGWETAGVSSRNRRSGQMKTFVTGALLPAVLALAACGGDNSAEEAADATDTSYDTGAVDESGATMVSPTDTSGAAGAGADTGAAAGGRAGEPAAEEVGGEAGSTADTGAAADTTTSE
jgi:hypothetical protein